MLETFQHVTVGVFMCISYIDSLVPMQALGNEATMLTLGCLLLFRDNRNVCVEI